MYFRRVRDGMGAIQMARRKEKDMEGARLYVGNLKYDVTNEQLGALFAGYGTVKEATVIPSKGFGFVEMSTPEEAAKAKDALNGKDMAGRALRIDFAQPMQKRDRGERPPRRDYR